MGEKYDNTVLIKLRRTYEKDESVSWLLNYVKNLRTEMGKSDSYIHELEDKVLDLEKKIMVLEKNRTPSEEEIKIASNIELIRDLRRRTEKVSAEKNKLVKENKNLVGEIARLRLKLNEGNIS
jgi:peptidoglycan hydrolase CwlO-like protein